MTISGKYRTLRAAALAAALGVIAPAARADDPPTRVGRIVLVEGAVSLHPDSGASWMIAEVNDPLTAAASLWTEQGARAEIEIGHARVNLGGGTELQVNLVDDDSAELTVLQGRIAVHLQHRRAGERYEVTTPRGTVALEEDGAYRIIAGTDQVPTRIAAFSGRATLALSDSILVINGGAEQTIASVDPLDSTSATPIPDPFDQWSDDRATLYATSVAPQYVSPEITGYEDLQIYGTWLPVPEYGVLWVPGQVPVNWAPYREGHWRWVPPWGWTWIDDQKWGFAPFHYGRWVNVGGIWGWLPGPATDGQPPAYAPALVTFVAAPDATIPEAAPIAWVPLAPGEIYQPAAAAQAPDAGPSLVGLSFVYFARLNPGARHEVLAAFEQDGAFRQRPPADGPTVALANQRFATAMNRDDFVTARPVQNGSFVPPPSAALRPVVPVGTIFSPPAPVAPLVNPLGPAIPPHLAPLPSSASAKAASERRASPPSVSPAPPPASALQPQVQAMPTALPPRAPAVRPPPPPPAQRQTQQSAPSRPDQPPPDTSRRPDPNRRPHDADPSR